jgi:hypothetical protein
MANHPKSPAGPLMHLNSEAVQCEVMPYNVFVSYSTKDIPNVDQLRQSLQFPDVNCFVSEYAVKPGAPLAPTIKASILACDLFILLWSKSPAASEWVSQEIGIAHASQKPILPFVLEDGLPLPGFIKELRYVAAYQNPQQSLYQLRETVLKNSMTKQNQQSMAALAIGALLILALIAVSKSS